MAMVIAGSGLCLCATELVVFVRLLAQLVPGQRVGQPLGERGDHRGRHQPEPGPGGSAGPEDGTLRWLRLYRLRADQSKVMLRHVALRGVCSKRSIGRRGGKLEDDLRLTVELYFV